MKADCITVMNETSKKLAINAFLAHIGCHNWKQADYYVADICREVTNKYELEGSNNKL